MREDHFKKLDLGPCGCSLVRWQTGGVVVVLNERHQLVLDNIVFRREEVQVALEYLGGVDQFPQLH